MVCVMSGVMMTLYTVRLSLRLASTWSLWAINMTGRLSSGTGRQVLALCRYLSDVCINQLYSRVSGLNVSIIICILESLL